MYLKKQVDAGNGYAVAELENLRHVYATATPTNSKPFAGQALEALQTLRSILEQEGGNGGIIEQGVFLRDASDLEECRAIMRDFYGSNMPAITYIPQQPCCERLITLEAFGVGGCRGQVDIRRPDSHTVVVRHNHLDWIHCSNIEPQIPDPNVYARTLDAFHRLHDKVQAAGCAFNHVLRTWLYLGDIVGPEAETQRYKELNRARTDFFRDIDFSPTRTVGTGCPTVIYPASTGIGTDSRDVLMSCLAVRSDRDDVVALPLENPMQTPAFDYAAHYSPQSPKFSRAMALVYGSCATIFISGTASILGSETMFVGDIEGQTRQTLGNIAALIAPENLARYGYAELGGSLENLADIRVYIKHREDYPKAKAICDEILGNTPAIYTIADVCRPDLLIEIEGVALTSA